LGGEDSEPVLGVLGGEEVKGYRDLLSVLGLLTLQKKIAVKCHHQVLQQFVVGLHDTVAWITSQYFQRAYII
jgi:hypothetical protein